MSKRAKRDKAAERLDTKTTTQNDPAWANMMEFFKANPAALMDALPTPPGSDAGDEPQGTMNKSFKKGLRSTQRPRGQAFNDNLSQVSGRSGMSNRSGASIRSGMSSNSRLKAGQSCFQRSNQKASRVYGGASDAGSRSNLGQGGQSMPSTRSNRDRYGGSTGGPGHAGSRSKDPYGIQTGQRARMAGGSSSGYGFGRAAKPGTAGAIDSTPQRNLAGSVRGGLSQNRIKLPPGELSGRPIRGIRPQARVNQTLSNFGAHTASHAVDGVKCVQTAAARAKSRPVAFSQKRQQSAANGLPNQPGLGQPRPALMS